MSTRPEYLDLRAIGEHPGVLRVVPIYTTDAVAYVDEHHSHLDAPERIFYASSVVDADGVLRCVACLARPKSRELQAQGYAEVVRVASDGAHGNAASMALGAIVRAARALGWERLCSYTILGEAGTIYRANAWWPVAVTRPDREWDCASRARGESTQPGSKVRWETYDEGVTTAMDCARKRLPDGDMRARQREASRLAHVMERVHESVGVVPIPPRPARDDAPLFGVPGPLPPRGGVV